jgi:hypothetical protein
MKKLREWAINHLALVAALLTAGAIGAIAQSSGMSDLKMQNGLSNRPTLHGETTTQGLYWGSTYTGVVGHLATGSLAVPAVSTCGTSAALGAGSSDTAGKITVGTSASNACTLTFATAYTTAPHCIVQNATTGAAANVYTVSTTAIVWSSALADSTVLYYFCVAPAGG